MYQAFYRIIDANYNRAREGLRVCEDIFRFLLSEPNKALTIKKIRRRLAEIISEFPAEKLLQARNVEKDEMKFKLAGGKKVDSHQLLRRNFQRVTEALRVLEEVSSVLNPRCKKKFMSLRFKVYELEKLFLADK
ncbi:MAG TPA: hypothetical protein ENF60_02050 [Candidatus Omnitrophica bacterium]|nr:hypothetical protein [Candidatus Omnitrophota bacterium]